MHRPPEGEPAARILSLMRNHLLILALTTLATPVWAQPVPHRIPPPDSDAYCQSLLTRISTAQVHGHAEMVSQLTLEGEQLCANGQSRRGIAKLRRALRIALTEG